ncbi:MAG: hypothetical protein ACLTH3_06885 [Lachnospira sp.]
MFKGKIKIKKKQFRTAAVAAIAAALTAGIIGTAVTSVKAAPLTWQDICSRGESDLTTVSSYDIKADCMQYGRTRHWMRVRQVPFIQERTTIMTMSWVR